MAELMVERDLTNVVLVAHSTGGLIGNFVMLDSVGHIAGMIAVATPSLGSGWARLMSRPARGRSLLVIHTSSLFTLVSG